MDKGKTIIAVNTRYPADIHQRVKELAKQEGRSFNAQLLVLVKESLNRARIKRES